MEFPFNAARSSGAAQRSAGQTVVALSSFNVWMCECDQGVPDEEIIALSEHEYLPEYKTESELDSQQKQADQWTPASTWLHLYWDPNPSPALVLLSVYCTSLFLVSLGLC